MKPMYVGFITKVLTTNNHCYRCQLVFNQMGIKGKFHKPDVNEYPEEVKDEFLRLSD